MIKTVSYALFTHPDGGAWKSDGTPGRIDGYLRYLPSIIRAHHVWWSGWTMVLHHDDALEAHPYFAALVRMENVGLVELKNCGRAIQVGYGPMWRFMPAFLDDDRIVLSHDIDSFPSSLLRRIAEEFAVSRACVAVVHGCETHNTAMAGLFLLRSAAFRGWLEVSTFVDFMNLDPASGFGVYGTDETYLRDVVWPKVWHRSILFRPGNSNPSLINSEDVRREITHPIPGDIAGYAAGYGQDISGRPLNLYTLGNSFSPYPGAAGFDTTRALDHFAVMGLPVLRKIEACELGVRTAREISAL